MSRPSCLFLLAYLLASGPLFAVTVVVGDQVELKATHHAGVPFHREPRGTNDFQRIEHGAVAPVVETAHEGVWLKLQLADGRSGWVHRKYVARVVTPTPQSESEQSVWESPLLCQTAVAAGARMAASDPEALRVATWNIRWFPRGCSLGEECPENATDLDWLACTITWMGLDLVAVQEILATPSAREAMDNLVADLDGLTGGSWASDLQACGQDSSQHVGFLWNRSRVTLSELQDASQLNGASAAADQPCAGNLRPGRYARVESAGGVDFHLLSVHLDSGRSDRDYEHRQRAVERLAFVALEGTPILETDTDVVALGDYNTMGRSEPPPISAADEIETLDQEIQPVFRRVLAETECTDYYRGEPGNLDHALVTAGMQEAGATARVTGYCAVEQCQPLSGALPAAFNRLSDHCPVVLEIRDEDLDPAVEPEPPPTPPDPGYYASVDATDAATLRATLHELIDDHTRFPYSALVATDTWNILRQADEDPADPSAILDVYRNSTFPKTTPFTNRIDREHSWPKSYGFKKRRKSNYPYTDCHALFLANRGYNGSRGNTPYRTCSASCDEKPTEANHGQGGGSGTYPGNSNWRVGQGPTGTWETWVGRRGDVARAQFYMDVRYEGGTHGVTAHPEPDLILTNDLSLLNSSTENLPVAHMGLLSVLLEWHEQDPVDDRERRRNEVISGFQGNRNPFIDHPEWVACLFQNQCS